MPEEEAGADLKAGGQSEDPKVTELRARIHRQHVARAGGPAEAEGDEPRKQRVPAYVNAAAPDLLRWCQRQRRERKDCS